MQAGASADHGQVPQGYSFESPPRVMGRPSQAGGQLLPADPSFLPPLHAAQVPGLLGTWLGWWKPGAQDDVPGTTRRTQMLMSTHLADCEQSLPGTAFPGNLQCIP